MQEKMASRNRLVRAIASATSHVWFPLSLALARRLPRRLLRALSRQTTMRFMQLRPKYQRALHANLAVILDRPTSSREVRRAARDLLDAHFTAWIDFLHFATRPPEEAARLVESVVGYSRIIEARARGNGVLLLTAHLGNWEIGGLMLAEMRQPIHVVLVPDIFPAVERARRALHERAGISEIRVDRSFAPTLAVLRALKSNAIVAMQGDRDFNNTGIAIPFFGRARSSMSRSRSPKRGTGRPCSPRTSGATSRSSSATSERTRSSGTASIPSGRTRAGTPPRFPEPFGMLLRRRRGNRTRAGF